MKKRKVAIPVRDLFEQPRRQWEGTRPYIRALKRAGFEPIPLALHSPASDRRRILRSIDAICFTGGVDVSPLRYGTHPIEKYNVLFDEVRDDYELELMDYTIHHDLPILAICRGMQLLNVYFGGTLWQDLAMQAKISESHRGRDISLMSHLISIEADSLLSRISHRDRLQVNSTHHQAIRRIAKRLRPIAYSPAGIIEAVEIRDYPFGLGVQFHPEELASSRLWAQRLFSALASAARQLQAA